ncbi:hypothetical protein TNCV_4883311 [Trichonephila clavipes]|nr:hypothetical protein TNCV_4883311 [Trichonephila clavipes]
MQPRCLKCGKNHATRNCLVKERRGKSDSASTAGNSRSLGMLHQMPQIPQPKKETPFGDPKKKREISPLNRIKEGISFANVVSGEKSPNQIPIDDKRRFPHGFP